MYPVTSWCARKWENERGVELIIYNPFMWFHGVIPLPFAHLTLPPISKPPSSTYRIPETALLLFSHSVVPTLHDPMDYTLPCPSPSPRVCSDSCPLSRWCHPTILSSSVIPFCFPTSGSSPMSWLVASGGHSVRASALASVLPMNSPEFPGGSNSKEPSCSLGDPGLIPGSGRSPGERNGNPSQYSCLENPMDRGAWQGTVHGVSKSWTWLSDFTSSLFQWIFRVDFL